MFRRKIAEQIIFPLVSLATKRKFWRYYNKSLKSQWLSKIELEKLQEKKVRKILYHAYERVPFYREIFEKYNFHPDFFNNISDLKRLPIITKKDLQRAGIEKTASKNFRKLGYYKDSTSGSTGEPFSFLGEIRHRDISTALALRGYNWAGYHPGEKLVLLWGYHKSDLPEKIYKFLLNQSAFSAFDIEKEFKNIIRVVKTKKPKLLVAYASAIVKFSKLCEERSVNNLYIPSIITSAETLYPKHRKMIEKTFKAKVFNRYGSRELGEIAHECDKHEGLHVSDENLIVEFEPFENYPKYKKIVVTHLDKYAMPLIRYDTGDLGIPSDKPCSCGRKLSLIKEVSGRNTDFIKIRNGKCIPFIYFNYIFEQYGPYIRSFQIIQNNLDKIIINIIPTAKLNSEIERKLKNIIKHKVEMEVEIIRVQKILLTKSGKKATVVSKI